MVLTHVQWTSCYECYRKHAEFKWSLMMNRSNIEWPTSRGLNIRLCHHGPFSLHTVHHFSLPPINRKMGNSVIPTHKDTQTHSQEKHTVACARLSSFTCSRIWARTQKHACIYTITFSQREINPGWSREQHCFHLRKLWFWNHAIHLILGSNCIHIHTYTHTRLLNCFIWNKIKGKQARWSAETRCMTAGLLV